MDIFLYKYSTVNTPQSIFFQPELSGSVGMTFAYGSEGPRIDSRLGQKLSNDGHNRADG